MVETLEEFQLQAKGINKKLQIMWDIATIRVVVFWN